jgi:hypothetical protein
MRSLAQAPPVSTTAGLLDEPHFSLTAVLGASAGSACHASTASVRRADECPYIRSTQ